MNNNMTDILEQYIKELFEKASENQIVIKRSNVAQKFDCVPSQLNYIEYLIDNIDGDTIEVEEAVRIVKILLDKGYIDKFDYNHFADSVDTVVATYNQFLEHVNDDVAEQMQNSTKVHLKDMTIKFLENIKYNKRG